VDILKVAFFSESAMCFSNLQNKIFQVAILNLKFKFSANNSKQQTANFKLRIVIWNISIFKSWKFEKQIALS